MGVGELSTSCLFRSSWCPSELEIRSSFPLGVGRAPLAGGSFDLLQGRSGGSSDNLPASAIFSDFFSLKYSVYQGAIFWGSVF